MESWVVGYDGDEDVERHTASGVETPRRGVSPLHLRVISDYI